MKFFTKRYEFRLTSTESFFRTQDTVVQPIEQILYKKGCSMDPLLQYRSITIQKMSSHQKNTQIESTSKLFNILLLRN